MKIHSALEYLIDLEERVGHLYIQFYKRFADFPGVADLWWEMALEEHEHAAAEPNALRPSGSSP